MTLSRMGVEFIKLLQERKPDPKFIWRYNHLSIYEKWVNQVVTVPITQFQFDALVSICMNIGCSKFNKSRLLVKVNRDPNDISIKDEFRVLNVPPKKAKRCWNLVYRRNAEADFYFGRRLL